MKHIIRRSPINLKSLSKEKRELFRQQAYAGFEAGKRAYAVAKELNLQEMSVGRWFRQFRAGGKSTLKERKRGPAAQTNAALSEEEVRKLLVAVTGSTPDQLMFDFALWSSRAVVAYVQKKFRKTICRRTARRYLRRLGFTTSAPYAVRASRTRQRWTHGSQGHIRA